MTAEAYELSDDGYSQQRPPEPSLELVSERSKDETLELAQATYLQFQRAFRWNSDTADAFFERIAGSRNPLSEELREKLLELYITSLSSSFVQDENRANYKFICELFMRKGYDVTTVREMIIEERIVEGSVDELYVTKHLLTTISKMSMHEE